MEIVLSFVIFILFFLAMSIGFLIAGKPLKGSCGGVATLMGNESCDICGGNRLKCEEAQVGKFENNLAINAMNEPKK